MFYLNNVQISDFIERLRDKNTGQLNLAVFKFYEI